MRLLRRTQPNLNHTFSNSAWASFLRSSIGICMSSMSFSCFLHLSIAAVYSFWHASTVSCLNCTSVLDASNTGARLFNSFCILLKLWVASSTLLIALSRWTTTSYNEMRRKKWYVSLDDGFLERAKERGYPKKLNSANGLVFSVSHPDFREKWYFTN